MMRTIFVTVPTVAFLLTLLAFVLPQKSSWRIKVIWAIFLFAAFFKFHIFKIFGGSMLTPEMPEAVIWILNWIYSGAFILLLLSFVWWVKKYRAIVLPIAAWSVGLGGMLSATIAPKVTEFTLDYPNLPAELDGYRIVHLTDLHISAAARRWRAECIVEKANSLNADLICLTGDHVDGRAARHACNLEPIRNLRAKDGVWAAIGNHELYHRWNEWAPYYERWGIRVLMNECAFPRPSLALGGVTDVAAMHYGGGRIAMPDTSRAFAVATNGQFRVLMQHRPEDWVRNRNEFGVDLQLSGHTHGGIMPIMDRYVAKHNGGFVAGVYDACFPGRLIVSRGAGQWAGFPCRFFNPSEIVVVTLKKSR